MNTIDELAAVALLAEPIRARLYNYVRDRHEPVGRDEAAHHAGISVKLAAFHLDRMAQAGLFEVDYRRLTGRDGPGAGRPAKIYSVSTRRFAISIPPTGYALAASIMATALACDHPEDDATTTVAQVAFDLGQRLGEEIRDQFRTKRARRAAVERNLEQLGFEPQQRSCELVLCNCIFAELAESHREMVCSMNSALIGGLLAGAQLSTLHVEAGTTDETCCVRVIGK